MKHLLFFLVVGITITVGLTACSNSGTNSQTGGSGGQNEIVITNDLENARGGIPGWMNENTIIAMKDSNAHSGVYASVISESFPYSYYYKEMIKNIKNEIPKSVTFSGWVYTTVSNPIFAIICDIKEDTVTYEWKAYPLDKELSETGKWVEFTSSFAFDKPLNPKQTIALYAWNQNKEPVYIDDLKVTFYY